MKKRILFISLAVVLALSIGVIGCAPTEQEEEENGGEPTAPEWEPDVHGEVTFSQLEWMETPEEALYPYSNVGEVEFSFLEGALDTLWSEYGGGWLNVVIDTTGAGGETMWAVQNLYLTYDDEEYLLSSNPSVQFSLGLDNDTRIDELDAAVFLSDDPFEEQPEVEELSIYTVSHKPYYVADGLDDDLVADEPHMPVGPWIGAIAMPVRTASIWIPIAVRPGDVRHGWADVEEIPGGCVPGSVTRSLSYLREIHGLDLGGSTNQEIYDELYSMMKTGSKGTKSPNFHAGKQAYFEKYGLDISDDVYMNINYAPDNPKAMAWETLIRQVQDALDKGCDVEMGLGTCSHQAMVVSITRYADGSTSITFVDDGAQGQPGGGQTTHVICTDNDGLYKNGARCVRGFIIECLQSAQEGTATFGDINLEELIRAIIGIADDPIDTSDLEAIDELDASGRGIADLTGLEYCTNLRDLYLGDNQISDISPLASLINLADLDLGVNQISDISPLAGLTNLERLSLDWNQISDLSPLADLTSLTMLNLDENQISDLDPLANLTSLTVLGVNYNEITDIDPLADLTSLEQLRLYSNQISDVSVIADLGNLEYLDLGSNQISDISPLVENEGLSEGDNVYLGNNPLSSYSVEIYIPQLEARGVLVDY